MKSFLKKVLPLAFQRRLKRVKKNFSFFILHLVAHSKITSSIFYTLLSRSFWREHHAVAFGRLLHELNERSYQGSSYLLRRNIHRLEKGLIMKPRRSIFALDYINETVHTYSLRISNELNTQGASDEVELLWATDVLDAYFDIIGSHPVIEGARQNFLKAKNRLKAERQQQNISVARAPYKRDLAKPISVSYDQLLGLAHRRRSVRWFLQKNVPRDLIDKAVSIAALSPSACNRQPFIFFIFDNKGEIKVQQVASLALGTIGFNQNFPALAVVVGQQRAYYSEKDRHLIYIDGSLAAMSFIFALETLGLSSCCINWPDIEEQERKMAKLLQLQGDERVIMLIAIGYPDPDEMVPHSAKKMLHALRRYG